jgi:glycosyltransferase involved in cell wall biosynthesis
VSTFSIHRADPAKLLSEVDRQEFGTTHALLPVRRANLVRIQLRLLRRAPRGYLRTLRFAIGLGMGLRGALWQVFYFLEATLLWNECDRLGLCHIHAHIATNAADVALLTARLGTEVHGGWSWSFTIHGPPEYANVDRFKLAAKVDHARFVVAISHYGRSQLMTLSAPESWNKLHVVRCSVDGELFQPPVRRANDEVPEILCIGRLVPEKGHLVLLDALAILRDRGYAFRATVAGGGPSADAIRGHADRLGLHELISFPGPVGQDEIRDFYSRAAIFCMPSFAEGLPGVIFEAMAMELPIVSTWITGVPELVVDGEMGYLVPPARSLEMADALGRLLDDAERRIGMGRAGRAKVLREFNPETLAERLEALFSEASWRPDAT